MTWVEAQFNNEAIFPTNVGMLCGRACVARVRAPVPSALVVASDSL